MDDLSAPSPWQASRFEIRTRLEPLDYLRAMAALKWTGLERFVAWLPVVGISGIGRHRGARRSWMCLSRASRSIPIGTGVSPPPLQVRWWRSSYTRSSFIGPYVDSMFQGQPIGMGEFDDRRRYQGRDRDVGRRRNADSLGQGSGRDRHQRAPVPDVCPAGGRDLFRAAPSPTTARRSVLPSSCAARRRSQLDGEN